MEKEKIRTTTKSHRIASTPPQSQIPAQGYQVGTTHSSSRITASNLGMTQNIRQAKSARVMQRKIGNARMGRMMNTASIHRKENNTGLPNTLKSGVEALSGLSLDDVQVHYNSDKPAQLQALAYAQGTNIHVASGQEKYLAHEAWHVVQQKQGRVLPTLQTKGVSINDDAGLEREADVMGKKALQMQLSAKSAFEFHFHGAMNEKAVHESHIASLQQKAVSPTGSGFINQVNDGLGTIQRATMVEYQGDPTNVHEGEVINDIVHERVLHTNADKLAAALASGYPAIPAGMICNHYESYANVRQRVYNQLIGLDLESAADWINARNGNLQPVNDMGEYRRFDVNQEVSDLIETLANHVNNLYYWPAKNNGNPDTPVGAGPGGALVGPQLARLNAYRATLP